MIRQLVVRGWAKALTLSVCAFLFLRSVVLAASQQYGCRLFLCWRDTISFRSFRSVARFL